MYFFLYASVCLSISIHVCVCVVASEKFCFVLFAVMIPYYMTSMVPRGKEKSY